MNKLREIECFIAVAELGSFVKAADALGISKAAVSRTVLELEARLGSRLMQRTTRRLSLTEAGSLYLERCKQIVADLEAADDLLSAGAARPAGLLRRPGAWTRPAPSGIHGGRCLLEILPRVPCPV